MHSYGQVGQWISTYKRKFAMAVVLIMSSLTLAGCGSGSPVSPQTTSTVVHLTSNSLVTFNHPGLLSQSSGWSTPEPGGTWSVSASPSLIISVPKFSKSADISFTSQANVSSKNPKVTMTILVNSSPVSTITYTSKSSASNRATRIFTIPATVLHSNFNNATVTLHITGAASPKSLGENPDVRNLGVYFINMTVKALN